MEFKEEFPIVLMKEFPAIILEELTMELSGITIFYVLELLMKLTIISGRYPKESPGTSAEILKELQKNSRWNP